MPPKVFITRRTLDEGTKLLINAGYDLRIYEGDTPISRKELMEGAKWADAIIPMLTEKIDKEFLNANKHLKCVANYAVGFFSFFQP